MAWLMQYPDALKINYLIFPRPTQAPSKTLFSNKHSKTKNTLLPKPKLMLPIIIRHYSSMYRYLCR